jgi:hypothetical protein
LPTDHSNHSKGVYSLEKMGVFIEVIPLAVVAVVAVLFMGC